MQTKYPAFFLTSEKHTQVAVTLMLWVLNSGRESQGTGRDVLVPPSVEGRAGTGTLCKGPDYQNNELRPSERTYMRETGIFHLTNSDKLRIRTIATPYWCFLGARHWLYIHFHFVNYIVIPILLMRKLRCRGWCGVHKLGHSTGI